VGIFGRIWRVIKGWLLIGVEKAEDPEIILTEAKEAMERELAKAKENAVTAIGHRNQLRNMLQEQQTKASQLEANARTALKQGNEALARQLLVEKGNLDTTVTSLGAQLEQAEQAAANVKQSIQQLEAQVRQRAAERLALIAGWKQAKIQEQLNKALSGISLDGQERQFERAKERVNELKAKADARQELASGSINQQLAALQNTTAMDQADEQLEKMKIEMGLAPAAEEQQQQQPQQTVRNIEV
jgi:phage shock protein A